MQGRKGYQEKLFTSFRLSDRVPEDNFYRRLCGCLDLRFLYKVTEKYYGKEGQASIDPVVFFKLLLTGYFENLQSDRKIIENARLRMDILYFIGYDIDEELPWHSTLSRTRQLYGEDVFRQLFQQVLTLCIDKGMVSGRRQAIDSVLVKANASMQSVVDKEVSEYIASLEKAAEEEGTVKKLPAANPKRSNKNRYSPTDPDARIATKPGKPSQLNYLGQISVDTSHHVITNIEAHHADKRDSACLPEVLDHTVNNLATHNLEIKEIVADTSYSSSESLRSVAARRGMMAYIPNHGAYKNERSGFTYQPEGDYYQCPTGARLTFKKTRITHGNTESREYRASRKDCIGCAFQSTCAGKIGYKTLVHSVDKQLFDEMHQRVHSTYGKKLRRLRQSTVEPVIGTLTNYLAMKRINGRGITQANKTIIGAAIAYNLKKWMNWKTNKRQVAAAQLQRLANGEIFDLIKLKSALLILANRKLWLS